MAEVILTIIIPIFNKENLLRQCLDSFASKDFEGLLEVLAVDDGSRDSSLSIAHEYEDNYPKIYKVVGKENGGVGSVMNLGLQNAVGKYIKEVDADDYVDIDALKKLLAFLKECDSDMIITPYKDVNEKGLHIKTHCMTGVEYGREYLIEQVLGNFEISIQSLTVRRKLLLDNLKQVATTRYYVDMQIIFESIYYARTITVLNYILYYYRVNQAEQSVNLESYVKNKESFRVQTELSLERFCRAQNDDITEIKKKMMKGVACGYSKMLYTIYLMDQSNNSEEYQRFEAMLRDRYPIVYNEVGKAVLVQSLRSRRFESLEDCKSKVKNEIVELKKMNYGNVSLGDVYNLIMIENADTVVYRLQKQRENIKEKFNILNYWFMNYQKGHAVEEYLLNRGFNRIAIYGFGELGQRLYQELLNSEVKVVYGIDRKVVSKNADFKIFTSPDASQEISAVIVTVINDYIGIASELRKSLKCPILPLEDVIYES